MEVAYAFSALRSRELPGVRGEGIRCGSDKGMYPPEAGTITVSDYKR